MRTFVSEARPFLCTDEARNVIARLIATAGLANRIGVGSPAKRTKRHPVFAAPMWNNLGTSEQGISTAISRPNREHHRARTGDRPERRCGEHRWHRACDPQLHHGVVRSRLDGVRQVGVNHRRMTLTERECTRDHGPRRQRPKLKRPQPGLCQVQHDESFRLWCFGERRTFDRACIDDGRPIRRP
jgi:hypothetical protein